MSLDAIGISYGTDKSSAFWGYLEHYERVFHDFKDLPINLIEIGVLGGRSVRTWKEYFPSATIVGIDIAEHARGSAQDRIKIEIGSQDDPEFLAGVCDRYPPSIVIDDGSHVAKHMLATLQHVFPRLLPGGWYVIEDLHIGGLGTDGVPVSPIEHLCKLATSLMAGGKGPVEAWTKEIDRLDIIPGAAFIRKADPEGALRALAETEKLVAQSTHAVNWYFLADTLNRRGAPPEDAERAVRHALAAVPADSGFHWLLGNILRRKGDLAGAIASAELAIKLRREEFARLGLSEERSDLVAWTAHLQRLRARQI
jgi:hypothetical protein